MSIKIPNKDNFDSELDHSQTDVDYIIKTIVEILKVMKEPEIKTLYETDFDKYVETMATKFKTFSDEYSGLFIQVLGNNIDIIVMMLQRIKEIQKGQKTQNGAEKELGAVLADNFLKTK